MARPEYTIIMTLYVRHSVFIRSLFGHSFVKFILTSSDLCSKHTNRTLAAKQANWQATAMSFGFKNGKKNLQEKL
jgi:hypothetical protein